MATWNCEGSPCTTVISARAAMRRSASFTVTIVFTSERKRTSFGAVGATISRVVHQMLAFCPGTSVASIVVWPFSEAREVISPGLITSRASENGQTTIEATLVPGQNASIWWTTREIVAPTAPKEVRFLSDVKTMVTVNEADLRIAALADITVVQGEPSQFQVAIPAGYEVAGATGASLESAEVQSSTLILKVRSAAQKSHQFLIAMEKSLSDMKADVPLLSFQNAQRETGEVLVEGVGTIELTATEGGGVKRMDFKETNPYLRSLGRFPLQAAFRYHKQPNEIGRA